MSTPGIHLRDRRAAERYLLGLELFGMRFGLDRMRRLMTVLGHPQQRFRSVHVVGSNGKSSTARMIAALLGSAGLRSGAYTSPHLISFCERIQVDGQDVAPARFAGAVSEAARAAALVNRTLAEGEAVTQFEALTAAAFHELAQASVDCAVIEAGLGGRWDATNVIPSSVQVLTSVGLEHTRWLGPTIRAIAEEKLDVVQRGSVLVVGEDLHPDASEVAQAVARERRARLVVAGQLNADAGAYGARYQRRNLALAWCAAEELLGRPLEADAAHAAINRLRVPGRFQLLDERTMLDGAHNPAGIEALVESLGPWVAGRPLQVIISVLDDKDAATMLRLLQGHAARLICTAAANPRALPPATLASLAAQVGHQQIEVIQDPHQALQAARAREGELVLATGSMYLISDLLRPPGAEPGSML